MPKKGGAPGEPTGKQIDAKLTHSTEKKSGMLIKEKGGGSKRANRCLRRTNSSSETQGTGEKGGNSSQDYKSKIGEKVERFFGNNA